MKNKLYFFYIIIAAGVFLHANTFAGDFKELPQFNAGDRVLVFAPHPDDEAIGAGGLIQHALKAGAKVKVACYTNGDHNEPAFIVYEKRLTFRRGEFIHMGEVRRKETLKAVEFLGIDRKDVIFMGYPDWGTMEILTKYWGNTKPFRDHLTRISKVPYPEALSYNAPYVGESILKDIKTIILDFKPNKIFVSHPGDTNRDHRSLYLFLRVALWDLEGEIRQPRIFPYIVHVVDWPKPRGYHPDLPLDPPQKFKGIDWLSLALTGEEVKAKDKMISFYKSQIECDPPYLFTFARANELFGDYPAVKLKKPDKKEIFCGIGKHRTTKNRIEVIAKRFSWQELQVNNNENHADKVSGLAYAVDNNNLFIKLTSDKKRPVRAFIFLLGYNRKTGFAKMPKINLIVDKAGLRLKEKKQTFFIKDAQLKYKDHAAVIKIPLSILGNPDYILSCAKASPKEFSGDELSWRILDLN